MKNMSFQILAMFVSLTSFLASFGGVNGTIQQTDFGPSSVFTAMICTIISTKLFYLISNIILKSSRFYVVGAEVDYRNALMSIFPLVICIMIFVSLNLILSIYFDISSFNQLISKCIEGIFVNISNRFLAGIVFTFLLHFLWFFGIHGGQVLHDVGQTFFLVSNTSTTEIVSKTFLDNFALIGGCGAALCLTLALLIASKTSDNKKLAAVAAPTIFFNINEILIFGLLVVLNPIMLIPFVLVPVISLIIAYFAVLCRKL